MNGIGIGKTAAALALAVALVAGTTPPSAAAKQDKKHPVCGDSPRVVEVGQTTGGSLPKYEGGETKYVSIEDVTWSPQDGLEGTHTSTKYTLKATPEGAGRLFTVTVAYKVQPMKKETKPIFAGKDANGKPIKVGEKSSWTENGKATNESCTLKILVRIPPIVAVLTTGDAWSSTMVKLPGDATPKTKDTELVAPVAEVDLAPNEQAFNVHNPQQKPGEGVLTFSYSIGKATLGGGKLTVYVVDVLETSSLSVVVPVGGVGQFGPFELNNKWATVVDGTATVDRPDIATVQTKAGQLVVKGKSVGKAKATALLVAGAVKGKLEMTIHVVDKDAAVSIPVNLVVGGPSKTVDGKDIKTNWANDGTIADDAQNLATFERLISVLPPGIADVKLQDGKLVITPQKAGRASATATFEAVLNKGKPPVGKKIVGVATIAITVVDAPKTENAQPSGDGQGSTPPQPPHRP